MIGLEYELVYDPICPSGLCSKHPPVQRVRIVNLPESRQTGEVMDQDEYEALFQAHDQQRLREEAQ